MTTLQILIFVGTFLGMEWVAWALHCYGMHGPLWFLHADHHTPTKGRWWQYNDFFAFFFAVPSFFSILIGTYWAPFELAVFGYGIMAYGAAYFFVHEVIIHRRLKLNIKPNWYVNAVVLAHRHHHQVSTKAGCRNFGMLVVPLQYFVDEWKRKPRKKQTA